MHINSRIKPLSFIALTVIFFLLCCCSDEGGLSTESPGQRGIDSIVFLFVGLVAFLIVIAVVSIAGFFGRFTGRKDSERAQHRTSKPARPRGTAHGSQRLAGSSAEPDSVELWQDSPDSISDSPGYFAGRRAKPRKDPTAEVIDHLSQQMFEMESAIEERITSALMELKAEISRLSERLDHTLNESENKIFAIETRLDRTEVDRKKSESENAAKTIRRIKSDRSDLIARSGIAGKLLNALSSATSNSVPAELQELKLGARHLLQEMASRQELGDFTGVLNAINEMSSVIDELGKIDQLLVSGVPDALKQVGRMQKILEPRIAKCTASANLKIASNAEIDKAVGEYKSRLINEISLVYCRIIQGRRPAVLMGIVDQLMSDLDLSTFKITLGETPYDPRLHDSIDTDLDPGKPPDILLNVLSMGYQDKETKEIVKAKVVTNNP